MFLPDSWYDACDELGIMVCAFSSTPPALSVRAVQRTHHPVKLPVVMPLVHVDHDMQYAQGGHAPRNTTAQDAELRHQIRRLSAHPSIVMWDGCNVRQDLFFFVSASGSTVLPLSQAA